MALKHIKIREVHNKRNANLNYTKMTFFHPSYVQRSSYVGKSVGEINTASTRGKSATLIQNHKST